MTFRHGLVVGKFYPPHAGHHALIEFAATRCAKVTVVVAPSSRESIPLAERLRWLEEVHAGTPEIRFVGRHDDHPIDYADPAAWDAHCALFREAAGESVDAVFSSEPEERYLGDASEPVRAAARWPDLYLLTDHAGVPFEQDGLRDGEHVREWMTGRFRAALAGAPVPVVELTGPHEQRLALAVEACERLLKSGWDLVDPL